MESLSKSKLEVKVQKVQLSQAMSFFGAEKAYSFAYDLDARGALAAKAK